MRRATGRKADRPQKVADQIQRELSAILQRELRDPRVGMVTLTGVEMSPDCAHATVYFTLLRKEDLADTLKGLDRAAGYLRSQLGRRVTLYATPQLRFAYDESVERGDRLARLIESVSSKR